MWGLVSAERKGPRAWDGRPLADRSSCLGEGRKGRHRVFRLQLSPSPEQGVYLVGCGTMRSRIIGYAQVRCATLRQMVRGWSTWSWDARELFDGMMLSGVVSQTSQEEKTKNSRVAVWSRIDWRYKWQHTTGHNSYDEVALSWCSSGYGRLTAGTTTDGKASLRLNAVAIRCTAVNRSGIQDIVRFDPVRLDYSSDAEGANAHWPWCSSKSSATVPWSTGYTCHSEC
jgi:hypothetical protein